jgi:CxxC-x17-CxxC domain-containing protein
MSSFPLHPEITFIGETTFRNSRQRFGIMRDDRRRHMYLIGKTGMGKSTMIENLVIQDIYNGQGVALVDPHGDLVETVIKLIPDNRIKDVIYFNPSDMEFPIAFNVVEKVDPEYRHLVASGLVGVFKKIWADSWGPRLEYLLRNVILALLDYQEATLLGIPRMFVDNNFRKKVIAKIQDPVVKSFWVDEFSKYNQQFLTEAISPIQNKVGQFLSSSLIRNVIGQTRSSFDLRDAMDNQKIILMNLSKGRIGEDNAALLGAMMITKIQLAAMSRVDIPEEERKDFYLYVDEFQNFATESFANILSEARKYRLNLIIAHQYIEQLGDVVKPAVFGNVGTMVCYRVGAADADELVKEFTPQYLEEDLVNNPKYNCYLRLMIDGIASEPFSAQGLPPVKGNTGNEQAVIQRTHDLYSTARVEVEQEIREWSGMATVDEEDTKSEESKRKKRNKKKVKKVEKLLPEYEQLARLGNHEAREIVDKLTQAMVDLSENIDVDLGAIVGRDEDDEPAAGAKPKPASPTPSRSNSSRSTPPRSSSPSRAKPASTSKPASARTRDDKPRRESSASKIPTKSSERSSKPREEQKKNKITCDDCGKVDHVNFDPDPNKPIYCLDCLKKRRADRDKRSKEGSSSGTTVKKVLEKEAEPKSTPPLPKPVEVAKTEVMPKPDPVKEISLKDASTQSVPLQHGSPKKEESGQPLQPGKTVKL